MCRSYMKRLLLKFTYVRLLTSAVGGQALGRGCEPPTGTGQPAGQQIMTSRGPPGFEPPRCRITFSLCI
jgi:hypothetical protein